MTVHFKEGLQIYCVFLRVLRVACLKNSRTGTDCPLNDNINNTPFKWGILVHIGNQRQGIFRGYYIKQKRLFWNWETGFCAGKYWVKYITRTSSCGNGPREFSGTLIGGMTQSLFMRFSWLSMLRDGNTISFKSSDIAGGTATPCTWQKEMI